MKSKKTLLNKLQGIPDSRSAKAIFSRGKNVYSGVSHAAHSGGGVQFGRPKKAAILRRIGRK